MLLKLPLDIQVLILNHLDIISLLQLKKSNKYILELIINLNCENSIECWKPLINLNQRISDQIIKKYFSVIHVFSKELIRYNNLSKDIYLLILNKYSEDIEICDYICKNYILDQEIIDLYHHILDWDIISEFQVKLWSNHQFNYFLKKYLFLFDHYLLLKNRILSEEQLEYIIQNVPIISWITISKYQDLSDTFINKFKDKIYFRYLLFNKKKKRLDDFSSR